MSIKSTVTLTREEAVNQVISKAQEKVETFINEMIFDMDNKEIENLLEENDSPFTNYLIKEEGGVLYE